MGKKTLSILLVAVFFCLSIVVANASEITKQEDKIAVVVVPARQIRADVKIQAILEKGINKKFDPSKFNVAIYGKDSSPAFMEFIEKIRDDNSEQAAPFVKKEHCIKYGQDIGASKVIAIVVFPADLKVSMGFFRVSSKFNIQADINEFSVPDDKYLSSKTYITEKKGSITEGVTWIVDKIEADYPIE